MVKKALITGVSGQDGSYLAELLLKKGYEVYGGSREKTISGEKFPNFVKNKKFHYVHFDLLRSKLVRKLIEEILPDEIYNLAAQSSVSKSFNIPEHTIDVNTNGLVRILNAAKDIEKKKNKKIRIYQASSSEMFGNSDSSHLNEKSPFNPQSPYACSKVAAHYLSKIYRESYGMFICNGILFNHESERRGENFVTKKIARSVAEIKLSKRNSFSLGNIDVKRDWGYAKDYVEAMWLMLQQDSPDDYVIATGENHSVREFLEEAFKVVGIGAESNNKKGLEEKYIDKRTGRVLVSINPEYFRPLDIKSNAGDCSKAKKKLRWKPKTKFKDIVKKMVEHEIESLKD